MSFYFLATLIERIPNGNTDISPDYCIVAFTIIIIISTVQWFVDGRKNFTGPRVGMGLEALEAVKSPQNGDSDDTFDPKAVEEATRQSA